MICPKCGDTMIVQTTSQTARRSIFTILIYIILLFIPVIGWIALFKILGGSRKTKSVSFAICPTCGHKKTL